MPGGDDRASRRPSPRAAPAPRAPPSGPGTAARRPRRRRPAARRGDARRTRPGPRAPRRAHSVAQLGQVAVVARAEHREAWPRRAGGPAPRSRCRFPCARRGARRTAGASPSRAAGAGANSAGVDARDGRPRPGRGRSPSRSTACSRVACAVEQPRGVPRRSTCAGTPASAPGDRPARPAGARSCGARRRPWARRASSRRRPRPRRAGPRRRTRSISESDIPPIAHQFTTSGRAGRAGAGRARGALWRSRRDPLAHRDRRELVVVPVPAQLPVGVRILRERRVGLGRAEVRW